MDPLFIFLSGLLILILFGWYFATHSEARKRILGSLITVLVIALSIASLIPPFDVPKQDGSGKIVRNEKGHILLEKQGRLQQGIDLKGGTSFLIKLKPGTDSQGAEKPVTNDSLDRAMEAIRKRVDTLGTSEPVIAPAPPDRILVQLPGADPDRIIAYRDALKKVAKLEFRMVHLDSRRLVPLIEAKQEILDPAYEILPYIHRKDGKEITEKIIVSKKVEITGDKVSSAWANPGQISGWNISLGFDSDGAEKFAEVTKRMAANKREREEFAIVMDRVVISAAGLSEEAMASGGLSGGTAIITGDFDEKEARNVASALLNPLENPVEIEEERSTSASLGHDAIQSGLLAGYIGAALTFLITLLYYRFAGFIANIALFIFVVLLFGAMGMFGAVLTLPGIAGILLTLGMAIDANVLIYERLREEQAAGKSLGASLNAAYDKAFSAIFDSNLTTLITAAILFWKASGPVKGFAVSLIIGVVASMFTALVVTRNLFSWGMKKGVIKKITMSNLIPATNFNFMSKRRSALIFSLVLIVASMGVFIMRGDKNFGVDFKGGDRIVMISEGVRPSLDKIRDALSAIGYPDSIVQTEQSSQGEFIVVRDREHSHEKIEPHLIAAFPEAKFKAGNVETVGSVVGRQLAETSIYALLLGMLGILIYLTIRFEFSFALGALVALLHDVLITVGVFALLGREFSLVTVGAILTIAGYSVNDTIVVFDRIRENFKSEKPGGVLQIMNLAINETLSRTILTGGVTFLVTIALMIFGGPVLNDFGLTMMLGILIGTYSSIFIASPIVLWWSGRGGRDLKAEVRKSEDQPAIPA